MSELTPALAPSTMLRMVPLPRFTGEEPLAQECTSLAGDDKLELLRRASGLPALGR